MADRELTLAQLLGDDRDGHLWVKEAVADDLPLDFRGAAVGGFGAAGLVVEGEGAAPPEGGQQLVIAGAGEAVLAGGGGSAQALAFAVEQHEQLGSEVVGRRTHEGAGGADEFGLGSGNFNVHGGEDNRRREICLLIYGSIIIYNFALVEC